MRLFSVSTVFVLVSLFMSPAKADDKPDLDKDGPQKYTPPEKWPIKVLDELKKLGDPDKKLKAFKPKDLPKAVTDLDFKVESFSRQFAYQTHWEDGEDVYVLILPDTRLDKKNPNADVHFGFSVIRKKGADGVEMDGLFYDLNKKEFVGVGNIKIYGSMIRDPKTFKVVGRDKSCNNFMMERPGSVYVLLKFTK